MFNPRTTTVRRISADRPDPGIIREAAEVLCTGGLVAFPTETVYGLGANALDAVAVEAIFTAKGRPSNNPIIVHVADIGAAKSLVSTWPDIADHLAKHFWPGSLTLVLPKQTHVPNIVTAGGTTVGVRIPAHPVALAVLNAARVPVAAPSANRATHLSPTTADHVLRGLNGRIDLILDAGPTSGGLESTVLDLTVTPPKLLRPGLVSIAQLRQIVGEIDTHKANRGAANEPARSPGQQPRHYAPRAQLIVSRQSESEIARLRNTVKRIGWLRLAVAPIAKSRSCGGNDIADLESLKILEMPNDPAGHAARFYAALHELDDAEVDVIVVDAPPETPQWLAIWDRLRRASHQG